MASLHWPLALCIIEVLCFLLVAIAVICKFERFHKGDKSSTQRLFEKRHLTDCLSGKVHPGWLFALRVVAFAYMFPVQLYDLIRVGPKVYVYYTQWTFTLLILYFAIATLASVKKLFIRLNTGDEAAQTITIDEESSEIHPRPEKDDKIGFLGYAMLVIFQAAAPAVLLTDFVYWFILVPFVLPKNVHHSMVDVSMHAVNAVFMIGEFILNTMPFIWYRGSYLIIYTVSYLIVQWVLHGARVIDWWPYPFLDVNTHWAPVKYFGLAMVHVVVFLLLLGVAKAKRSLIRH